MTEPRRRTAILISGRGSNMAALLAAAAAPAFPAEIVLVFANRTDAAGLDTARAAGIEAAALSHRAYPGREDFDRAVDAELRARNVDLVCLAGFMRVVSPWFCERWLGRMISIHPALLPSFKGLDTHARALDAGVKIHGASVHFVVPELDAGPIIAQAAVPVLEDDTPDSLAARVLRQEHVIYPRALQLVASGRVRLEAGRTVSEARTSADVALAVPDA
ncbi:phosphoribosylglycinamide formyltransferase [Lichenibacterium ramalinae]|uniref:Phosphoribosylglycinamide formyltransferase n=1 Tax=Lichenibacterium ramalinae TaxID=2316527 RepID=A0A4Q2R7U9_9HYPH|nr:phosphoribosylglycinamide formyltransferase [Lichenibacterium ramalinae]RYB02051.1 phosphoribosylglycinamide formyltransferase [Lichenibacterium ramalinae]